MVAMVYKGLCCNSWTCSNVIAPFLLIYVDEIKLILKKKPNTIPSYLGGFNENYIASLNT